LSYAPAMGTGKLGEEHQRVNVHFGKRIPAKKVIRIADAKEVGVGNPAEETYRYPNQVKNRTTVRDVKR